MSYILSSANQLGSLHLSLLALGFGSGFSDPVQYVSLSSESSQCDSRIFGGRALGAIMTDLRAVISP